MQPLSGNQRPDLLTALMNMSLVLSLPRNRHLCRSSSNAPRLPSFLEMPQTLHVLLTFDKVHNPLRLPRETTPERPKVARTCGVFNILTSKCASRIFAPQRRALFWHLNFQKWSEYGVLCTFWLRNVLRATTPWSGPGVFLHFDLDMCFVPQRRALFRHLNFQKWSEREVFCDVLWHFDLEMCFVPQRRALFRHRNFQKWSGPGVFCAFWLGNVLRATTACTFSSLIWPDGSAPAALASLLFDPPEPQIMGKTPGFATFLPFRAPGSSFFWDFLFSDLLSSSLLFSSLFFCSTSAFICPYCRKFDF